jgi:hypothetical protein
MQRRSSTILQFSILRHVGNLPRHLGIRGQEQARKEANWAGSAGETEVLVKAFGCDVHQLIIVVDILKK